MKAKNKFMIALLSAACMCAGAAGLSACSGDCKHVASGGWCSDELGHWHECTECGDIFDYEKHNDLNNGLCDVCGFGEAGANAEDRFTQDGLRYRKRPGGAGESDFYELIGFEKPINVNLTDLVVPAEVNGLPVKEISNGVFSNLQTLKSVTLPEGLEDISYEAFEGCVNLQSLTLPQTISYIGNYAFQGCTSLKKIHIPQAVYYLGSSGYSFPFYGCTALEEITVDSGNEKFCSEGGILYNKAKTEIIYAPKALKGKITVPDGMTKIANYAFQNCKGITSVALPEGVTEIGNYAFEGCESMREITFSIGLTKIGEYAFKDCRSLNEFVVPDGVTDLKSGTFEYCYSLYKVTLGKGLAEITGSGVFRYCKKLIEVCNLSSAEYTAADFKKKYGGVVGNIYTETEGQSRIKKTDDGFVYYETDADDWAYLMAYVGDEAKITVPEKLGERNYTVYDYAFAYNDLLQSVTFPQTATEFWNCIFEGCDNLTEIKLTDNGFYICRNNCIVDKITGKVIAACKNSVLPAEATNLYDDVYAYNDWVTEITLSEGMVVVNDDAFSGCKNLKKVTISSTVKEISAKAFTNCGNLETIIVDQNNPYYCVEGGILYNKDKTKLIYVPRAFKGELIVPEGVTEIAQDFSGYEGITAVTLPNSLTWINNYMFMSCVNLKKVTLGNAVTGISSDAFSGCARLAEINLPEGLTEIRWTAFSSCRSLTSITIPSTVTQISNDAFQYCDALAEIYNLSSVNITAGATGYEDVRVVHTSATVASRVHKVEGGFAFYDDGTEVVLLSCNSAEDFISLPENYNGKNYSLGAYFLAGAGKRTGLGAVTLKYLYIPASITVFEEGAFSAGKVENVFYGGTQQTFDGSDIMQALTGAESKVYICSATKPDNDMFMSWENFWHKVGEEIVVW